MQRDHDRDVDFLGDFGAARALLLTRVLRATILALCSASAYAAWVMESPTVVGLALVIAAEETWETSVVIAAVRRGLGAAPMR
jgi:hypothetical protein